MSSELRLFDDLPALGSTAVVSEDGVYRYELTRTWDVTRPAVAWVMLNPSTADASVDDPTIRRCISFARTWGWGGIVVVNLFALRATDPKALNTFAPNDPIGDGNNEHIFSATANRVTVAAWGASVPEYWRHRPRGIAALLRERDVELYHLGLTKDGHPRHPLYVAGDTELIRWAS